MTPTYADPGRVPAHLPATAQATRVAVSDAERPVILCRLPGRVLARATPAAAAEWAEGPRAALLLSRARQGKGA